MKILIFTNMYPTKDKPQFGIYVYNQIKYLEELGHQFKIINLKSKGNKYFRYLGFFIRGLYYSLFMGKKYDVVHAHYAFPPGLLAMIHKIRYKSKLIVTLHGSDINKMPMKSRKVKKLINYVLQHSDKIISVSDNLKEKVISMYGIKSEKINIINMGVNNKVFIPNEKVNMRKKLGLPLNKEIFLFVGNFYYEKGVIDLINSFRMIKNNKDSLLILIGDNTVDERVTSFVSKVTDNNIILRKPMSQKEIVKYMNASDVFVLPSYTEGFNLVTLEAMSTGTIVVGTNIEGLKHLRNNAGIIVEVANIEDLKSGMEYAMEQKDNKNIIDDALKVVEENSMYTMSKRVSKIYEEVK